MFTWDAPFYKRNAVLDEHPWYLVPAKWMEKAHRSDDAPGSIPTGDEFSPSIMHSCTHNPYNRGDSFGSFVPEDFDHDFRCQDCKMRPSDKMITLYTLLK